MSSPLIRRMLPGDAVAVRELRLEGLRDFPESFGSSWEEEATEPLRFFAARLEGPSRTLGAHVDGTLVGMVVVSPNYRVKLAHNFEVAGFLVRRAFHRRGVGRALMQSAMELMRSGEFPSRGIFATLTVSGENEAARRLYENFGFEVCGRLQQALLVDDVFHDELLMRARIS